MIKYEELIGKKYEDPEGMWEITNIVEENKEIFVEIKCIQEENSKYGDLFAVPIEEAIYFLKHKYPWR